MNKIDFAVIISVNGANPNGDPLTNIPRIDLDGRGVISDVSIKRKIRNTLEDMGEEIFVKKYNAEFPNLKERIDAFPELKAATARKDIDEEQVRELACEKWMDVRTFGQVISVKGSAVGIRGPVSITSAHSLDIIDIEDMGIVNTINVKMFNIRKYKVSKGAYVFYGGIYPQLAELTGFDEKDVEKLKEAIVHMLDNDMSVARPVGSMNIEAVYWWKHNCKIGQYAPITIQRSLHLEPQEEYPYYHAELKPLEGIEPEIIRQI